MENLVKNIIQFNEFFHQFEENVASTMKSENKDNFEAFANINLLYFCQEKINNMILNLKTNDIK